MDDLAFVCIFKRVAEHFVVRVFASKEVGPWAIRVACPHVLAAPNADYGPEGQALKVGGGCEHVAPAVACGRSDWFRVAVEDTSGFRFELFDQVVRLA